MATPTNHTSSAAFFHGLEESDPPEQPMPPSSSSSNGRLETNNNNNNVRNNEGTATTSSSPTALPEEEKSRISLASSIDDSNILHADSKSGHSRLSTLLGPAGIIPSSHQQQQQQQQPQPHQQLLSPLSEEVAVGATPTGDRNTNETPPTDLSSNPGVATTTPPAATTAGGPTEPSSKTGQKGILRSSKFSVSATSTGDAPTESTAADSDNGGSSANEGQPMTMSQHLKNPPPPPPNPPPSTGTTASRLKQQQQQKRQQGVRQNKSEEDDGNATAFTVGTVTNTTQRTFGAVPGNVPSETLHTSNIRGTAASIGMNHHNNNNNNVHNSGNDNNGGIGRSGYDNYNNLDSIYIDDNEVDKVAAWAIHLALLFFMVLVLAVIILALVVMNNYGLVTLVFLSVVVLFVAGLGWFVDQTVLSRNPKLRPVRRKILTVVVAAKKKLVEEYHLFVLDWKEHQLLLTQDPHYNDDSEIENDEMNTSSDPARYSSMESNVRDGIVPTDSTTPGRKRSKVFKLVKPLLGLGKKMFGNRRKSKRQNSHNETQQHSSAVMLPPTLTTEVNGNKEASSYVPPTSTTNI